MPRIIILGLRYKMITDHLIILLANPPPHPQLSALNLACWTNQEEMAMLLLEGKADPNIVCERTNLSGQKLSCTALWWAACHDKADLCRELLKHGARTDIGESPLAEAASEEIRDMILNSLN